MYTFGGNHIVITEMYGNLFVFGKSRTPNARVNFPSASS